MKYLKLLLVFCFLICATIPVNAEMVQVATVYKMDDVEIIAVRDCDSELGKGILIGDEVLINELMPGDTYKGSVNTYVIKKEGSIILVDTGYGAPKGQTVENLKGIGIMPEMVNSILLTHLHIDHVSGLLQDGEKVFPNARIYVAEAEYNYWFDDEIMANSANSASFEIARKALEPYKEQLQIFEPGLEVLPGIVVIDERGHTAGHVGYLLITENNQMLIWGDLTHFNDVQMAAPGLAVAFDTDYLQAIDTRLFILDWVATDDMYVAGMHIIYPGIGKVKVQEDGSYVFVPLNLLE